MNASHFHKIEKIEGDDYLKYRITIALPDDPAAFDAYFQIGDKIYHLMFLEDKEVVKFEKEK